MLGARQVAQYFLAKDSMCKLFNKNLIQKNGRNLYEGNARLNKYLHMAQNLFIPKTGEKLFQDEMYAYDNGAVALDVQENYAILWSRTDVPEIPVDIAQFLDKVYKALKSATLDELIELSHEDSEWGKKNRHYAKQNQKMDSLAHAEEYREQYADMLRVMERMSV